MANDTAAPSCAAERPEVSVVIPAYNEARGIEESLRRTVTALRAQGLRFEVVLVDDGSTDDTRARAEAVAAELPEIRVHPNVQNRGGAESTIIGWRLARGEVVIQNGADLPFDPADTTRVLERVRAGADVVVVERADRQAYGVVRKVVSWTNIALIRLLFGSPFHDHNFVQAYRREVLESVEVLTRGVSTITPELILKSRRRGFRVESITCDYHERRHGKSTITVKNVVYTVQQLGKLWAAMHARP